MQATAKKMVKSRSSQLRTSRAFCQNLRGILDKSDEEERWEVVRGELLKEKKRMVRDTIHFLLTVEKFY